MESRFSKKYIKLCPLLKNWQELVKIFLHLGRFRQLSQNKFLDPCTPSMIKVDDGEEKKGKKEKEKNGVFSGHYVIASSQRLRPKFIMFLS